MVDNNKNTYNSPEQKLAAQEFQAYMSAKALLDSYGVHAESAAAVGTFCNFDLLVERDLAGQLFTGETKQLPMVAKPIVQVKSFRVDSTDADEASMQKDIHLGLTAAVGDATGTKDWSVSIYVRPETPSTLSELIIEGIGLSLGSPRCDAPRLEALNTILEQAKEAFGNGILTNKGPDS